VVIRILLVVDVDVIGMGLSVHITEDLRQERITAGATRVLTKEIARKPWITGCDAIVTAYPGMGDSHAT
jgi:hypothetical protein